jgi:hypothetical protein
LDRQRISYLHFHDVLMVQLLRFFTMY